MTQSGPRTACTREALDWELEHRQEELRAATRRKHRSALSTFVDWTYRVDLSDLTDLTGRRLVELKTWQKTETDLRTVSLNGNLAILRRFLGFCEPGLRTGSVGSHSSQ